MGYLYDPTLVLVLSCSGQLTMYNAWRTINDCHEQCLQSARRLRCVSSFLGGHSAMRSRVGEQAVCALLHSLRSPALSAP
eukprot:scaffold314922_cov16-Prasinocladus_malaysianus.AAC.2